MKNRILHIYKFTYIVFMDSKTLNKWAKIYLFKLKCFNIFFVFMYGYRN